MIVHPYPQGSDAWLRVRLGKITASNAEAYFAPDAKRLRLSRDKSDVSDGVKTYLLKLLTEWYTGQPQDEARSQFMQRGNEMEAEARAAYEFHEMVDVRQCGFIESPCGSFGCSVDGLVGDDGLVEIKVLGMPEHLRVFHYGTDRAYAQVQAQLLDADRAWCDRFFFNPEHYLWVDPIRTERDEEFIDALRDARNELRDRLQELQQVHLDAGFKPPKFDPKQWNERGERQYTEEDDRALGERLRAGREERDRRLAAEEVAASAKEAVDKEWEAYR
jgi:hypothetical protein